MATISSSSLEKSLSFVQSELKGTSLNANFSKGKIDNRSNGAVASFSKEGKQPLISKSGAPKSKSSRTWKMVPKVSRRDLINAGAGGLLASLICPLCNIDHNQRFPNLTIGGPASASEWSYGDLSGPIAWGEVCKEGAKQSPIDITLTGPVPRSEFGSFKFNYASTNATYMNTGHGTMQVNFPAGSNFCEIGDRKLELLQYHFHAPSEHSFNGIRSAMEGHLVHKDQNGRLAVVGVMMESEPNCPLNLCLEAALSFAPKEKGAKVGTPTECFDLSGDGGKKVCLQVKLSPASLLPKPDRSDGTHSYIHYKGSLTTPPCSEGVDWFVLANPIRVPDSQVIEFMRYVGDQVTYAINSRPIQAMGDRQLFLGP